MDVLDARYGFGHVLRHPFFVATLHNADERHFAAFHLDFDLLRVDVGVLGQALAHILANALVGPLIPLRTATGEPALIPVGAEASAVAALAAQIAGRPAIAATRSAPCRPVTALSGAEVFRAGAELTVECARTVIALTTAAAPDFLFAPSLIIAARSFVIAARSLEAARSFVPAARAFVSALHIIAARAFITALAAT